MRNKLKIFNKRVFAYAFLIWLNLNISGIQNLYFSNGKTLTIIIVKILHLFFLYGIFLKLHSMYNKRNVPKVKNEIIISIVYFLLLIVLLLLTWPGTWSWDDIKILINASSYNLTPWQHFFSGLFQILCLQTIPIPSGVIIVQIIIASMIVGYSISNISSLYGKNEKQVKIMQIFLGLITLLPPVVMYILCGFRMGMYSYFELWLITELIILYKEQKRTTINDILRISFITIIISSWRTEGLYYPFFILILYFILGKKVICKKAAIISILLIMIFNVSIGKINNYMIGNNDYSLTATTDPITALVRNSDESDKEEIEIINKVIDVQFIIDNPDKTSEKCFWEEDVVKDYSKEEYNNYLKAYVKLALKHPDVVLKSMCKMFLKTGSGFGEDGKQTTRNMVGGGCGGETLKLYDIENGACIRWNAVNSDVLKNKKPINLNLRNNVISFLNGIDVNGNLTIIHNVFWNLFIPFTLILICLVYKLIKKDWFMVFLILAVCTRIPLIFVTAPAPYFMYYLSTYVCSYVISFIVIFEIINQNINKKPKSNINTKEMIVYKKSKKEIIKKIFKQFLSFLLVSGIGWIIDFSIYILLISFGKLKVGFANILSSIPAITYVFLMSDKKIFKDNNSKLSLKVKYLIYFGYQLILLLSISGLAEFLYNKLIDFVTVSFLLNNLKIVIKILITPITMTMNFIVMKNLIERL